MGEKLTTKTKTTINLLYIKRNNDFVQLFQNFPREIKGYKSN